MEFNKIEVLLEKYFAGETSIADEKELKDYFHSSNVSPDLEQYKPLFGFFVETKKEELEKHFFLKSKNPKAKGLSIAAAIVVLLGMGTFIYFNENELKKSKELGTYEDPKEAFIATQNALGMLSKQVNEGFKGIEYIGIYERTKNRIFIN